MLEKDLAVMIHIKNLQFLMTEVFKAQHSLNPTFMKEIFVSKNSKSALRNEHPISFLGEGFGMNCQWKQSNL